MAHILIIEDHRDTRDITELILTEAGHTVVSARDAVRGVQLAEYDQPDLILMDLALPCLDGWEATRRLKANPATSHIPVLAFTVTIAPDALARALTAGCVAVIPKPFEIDDLLHAVAARLVQHVRRGQLKPVAVERGR
jgi:two-component system, cell cycle response regulator DivK